MRDWRIETRRLKVKPLNHASWIPPFSFRLRRCLHVLRLENDLLYSPGRDFGNDQFVLIPAIDRMDRAEFSKLFPGLAELTDDGAVQFHLVNLAADGHQARVVIVGIRIRTVQILVRAGTDANGPRCADVIVNFDEVQIAVEYLNTPVPAVRDVNISFGVGRDRARRVHLSRLRSTRTDFFDDTAVLVVLRNARIAVSVRNVDVPCGIPGNIGRPVEPIRLRGRRWGSGRRRWAHTFNSLFSSAHRHHNASFRTELDDHIGSFIYGPDVVLRIDADPVRHLETV